MDKRTENPEENQPSANLVERLFGCSLFVAFGLLIASLSLPTCGGTTKKAILSQGQQHAKEIVRMFKHYALDHEGTFPEFDSAAAERARFTNSTDAFNHLMQETDMDSEEVFSVTLGKLPPDKIRPNGDHILSQKENWFFYNPGMNDSKPPRTPLIMCESPIDEDEAIVGFVGGDVRILELSKALKMADWLEP